MVLSLINIEIATNHLINTIKNDPTYLRYLDLASQLASNKQINDLIKEIKDLQKLATIENHKGSDIKDLEKHLKDLQKQLDQIPLYIEYSNALDEVNNCFNLINKKLNDYIENEVNF